MPRGQISNAHQSDAKSIEHAAAHRSDITAARGLKDRLARYLPCWIAMAVIGCGGEFVHVSAPVTHVEPALSLEPTNSTVLRISAAHAWSDSGIDVRVGEPVHFRAYGRVSYDGDDDDHHGSRETTVTPKGTWLHSDEVIGQAFPLPATSSGPAPCYCLIGRIDDGPAFYIGEDQHHIAGQTGRLYLGINDFECADNSGHWTVEVQPGALDAPIRHVESISGAEPPGCPVPNAKVVVFYVDGLRPDVVREMTAMGHLPHIRRHFIDNGTWAKETYTGFPSNTITSNGSMWTGCFSDRHGIKGQVRFSRRSLRSHSYLEPLGPHRSSATLQPTHFDELLIKSKATGIGLTKGKDSQRRYEQTAVTHASPLYSRLQERGSDWATGILPVMSETPPLLWTRSMTRYLPYFQSQNAWQYIDDANTHYALKQLISRKQPVTIIWLPETDSVSHKKSRGQFGLTRRTIARADVLIGKIVEELIRREEFDNTYLMLVSDHGHHGGRAEHLANYDIAHHVFYEPRIVDDAGFWTGGGLGMSVRQHRSWSRHPEDHSKAFVYLDANSDGSARIFLPRGHFHSGQWEGGANRPGDLLAYRVAPGRPAVNLVEQLLTRTAVHPRGSCDHPVDLVLMKLHTHAMMVSTKDRGTAVIERRRGADSRWEYRYSVVTDVEPASDGGVNVTAVPTPQVDPLGISRLVEPDWLTRFHSEREWLNVTSATPYPDSVVTLTRHMLWDESLAYREAEYSPDLVVTAKAGWYFGMQSSSGTMHGYPLRDAMRASWFISGPNIRRGAVLETPSRLVDLTPTILEMIGQPAAPAEVDGQPLRTIYHTSPASDVRPEFWSDVDLQAWSPLAYRPVPEYRHLPKSINRPNDWLDLNNIAYNALTVPDLSVVRLADTALFPWRHGNGPLMRETEELEFRSRRSDWKWWAEATDAVDPTGIAIGDYTITSQGNLQRLDGALNWVQARASEAGHLIAAPFGGDHLPGMPTLNRGIDGLQSGAWDLYQFGQRIVMKVIDEGVINGVENTTDRNWNKFHRVPAEVMQPSGMNSQAPR